MTFQLVKKERNKIQIHLCIIMYLKAKAREKDKAAINFNLIFLNFPKELPFPSLCILMYYFFQLMERFMLNALKWTPETCFPRLALTRNEGPSAGKTGEAQDGGWGREEMVQSSMSVQSRVPHSWGRAKMESWCQGKAYWSPCQRRPSSREKSGLGRLPISLHLQNQTRTQSFNSQSCPAMACWGAGFGHCRECFSRLFPTHLSLHACLHFRACCRIIILQKPRRFSVSTLLQPHFQQRLQLPRCWRGSAAGPPSGRWSSGSAPFPTEPPRQTPHGPVGTPRSCLLRLSPFTSCPISFSAARGLLAVLASGHTAGDYVRLGEGVCALRRAWEPGPHLSSSDLGPTGHHLAQEFIRQGCWKKPPSIRTWAHPWPDPRQDHHLVRPAWALNQIGVSACPLHWSSRARPHHWESLRACVSGHGRKTAPEQGFW